VGNKITVRVQTSILSKIEKRVLEWMANRLSYLIKPDHLTCIGLIGAILAGVGYILSNFGKGFLWLSSFGLIINWFGDSLDGTLARVRKIQRPTYGFYLDHNVDAITALIISVGAGISPFVSFSVVMLLLSSYFLLSIFTYINTYLKGTFKISYSGLGPTELRLVIILINTVFFFLPSDNPKIDFLGVSLKLFDLFALCIVVVLITLYFYYFFAEKNVYEKEDPPFN
jgi:archaetidylinositol phosphate synthase